MAPKIDKNLDKKISDLEQRVKSKRKEQKEEHEDNYGIPAEETSEEKRNKRAASEFLGMVIGGCIFGFVIDKYAGIAPWGMFFFIIMGFVGGVYRAEHTSKINEKEKDEN